MSKIGVACLVNDTSRYLSIEKVSSIHSIIAFHDITLEDECFFELKALTLFFVMVARGTPMELATDNKKVMMVPVDGRVEIVFRDSDYLIPNHWVVWATDFSKAVQALAQ